MDDFIQLHMCVKEVTNSKFRCFEIQTQVIEKMMVYRQPELTDIAIRFYVAQLPCVTIWLSPQFQIKATMTKARIQNRGATYNTTIA